MAIFSPGPMAGQVSGRIGSVVFSHNRGGPYVRNGTIPTVVTSDEAILAKARMTAASQAWKNGTDAQRRAWKIFAEQNPVLNRLGKMVTLSGASMFNRFICRMDACGDVPITQPPVGDPPSPLTSLLVVAEAATPSVTVAFLPTPLAATQKLMIWACLCESDGISYVTNLLRLVKVSGVAQASPYEFAAPFVARFGPPQEGQTIHVRVNVYDNLTGLVSQVLQSHALVTAV